MQIKVSNRKWYGTSQKRSWQRLANYVVSHYPKDSSLHQCIRGAFRSFDDCASKLAKSAPKGSKRRTVRKRRKARRATPKRRTAKRRTARRSKPKRRTAKRTAPKRRTARRGVVRRRRRAA